MSSLSRNVFLAAAVLVLPAAAGAATLVTTDLNVDQFISVSGTLVPGDQLEFRYNVLQDLEIGSIAVSGTGNSSGADLTASRFGYTSPGTSMFTDITTIGTSTFGGGFLSGLKLGTGDAFSVFFEGGVSEPISVTLSFATTPASIPIPASGVLMGGVLLGLGAFARRGRKADAGGLSV